MSVFVSSSNSCTLGRLYNELFAQGRPLQLKATSLRVSILKMYVLVVVDSCHDGSSDASRCGRISREGRQSSRFIFASIRFKWRGSHVGPLLSPPTYQRPFWPYIGVKKDSRVLALARQTEARICIRRLNEFHSGSKVQHTFQVVSQLIASQPGV